MRTLELPVGATPTQWGQLHGESFRGEVQSLAAIRIYLCTRVGGFADTAAVLRAGDAHLPVLEKYDRALFDEVCGIAAGANVTPAHIVVANHYTDLRDLPADPKSWKPAPTKDDPTATGAIGNAGVQSSGVQGDGCSVIWAETPTGRVLAQTWDMHATAIPFVMMIKVPAIGDAPASWLLSVTGCLGMAGMNSERVGLCINNLFSTDATLGIVWPAMVRKALRERTARAARDVIMTSPIGSGHHYFVADKKDSFAIETSGTRRAQIFDGASAAYYHTNHCLDPMIAAQSKVPPTSTTYDRYAWLERDLARAPIADLADVWHRLGSKDGWPRSVSTNLSTPEAPHGAATAGAVAMNLDRGELWGQGGFITNVKAEEFKL